MKINIDDDYYYLLAKKMYSLIEYADIVEQRVSIQITKNRDEWYVLFVDIFINVNRRSTRFVSNAEQKSVVFDAYVMVQNWILVSYLDREEENNFVPLKLKTAFLNLINQRQWKDKQVIIY